MNINIKNKNYERENVEVFNIEEELKKLPDKPGVYIMHGEDDEIIYVGKAVVLKNRVRQYFQNSRNHTNKIKKMVSHIRRFEYIITDSELEALVLECNLIKEHRPRYNTMLKDDKAYPFIRVTVNEAYPRIQFSRTMKKDKSKYFGPYTSVNAVKDTIELLRKIYHIRSCNRVLPRDCGKDRPCLYHHIHQCDAPCQNYISKEEYNKNVEGVLDFLSGKYADVLNMLEKKMYEASELMEFEKAAEYRDLMNSVKQVAQKQKITDSQMLDRDIIACAKDYEDAVIQVFFVRDGRLIGREHFHIEIGANDTRSQIIQEFIKQYYSGTPFIPKELMIQEEIEEKDIISSWLTEKRGQKVSVRVPKKGEKEKLVELAYKNAAMVLDQDKERIKREELKTTGAMNEIKELLGIDSAYRMEAYDISNISGFDSVGSMIVYEGGRPKRNDYRKFKIKWVKGANDYKSMEEVLTRRFSHGLNEIEELKKKGMDTTDGSFTRFPDIIMMDGGRGQVNVALKVLEELKINIPVCGMVKDDNHRTRGLYYNNVEIPIDIRSEAFKLITRIQDEAHRFAIEFHKDLRSKGQIHSVLDDIEGIGPTRRKALLRKFKTVENIRDASLTDLINTEYMNENTANNVYNFFH